MHDNVVLIISCVAACVSAVVSAIALIATTITQKKMKNEQIKQKTIEAFSILQNEVLDNLVKVDRKNAELIVNSLDNPECKKAYDDYRTLIARLEHFAVGVENGVYDFEVIKALSDTHLYHLSKRVKPIIDKANQSSNNKKYYSNFIDLANRLK